MDVEVLVLYYSRHGSVAELAAQVARGVNAMPGAAARLRTVPPVTSQAGGQLPPVPASGPPYATAQDLEECAGLLLGSPTRFGGMAAPLRHFLDGTGTQWLNGTLSGKPAGVFTSSNSMHGGQESTLLSMALPLLHHGMLLVGVPYTDGAVSDTRSGGGPYGASHVAPTPEQTTLTAEEVRIATHLGRRVAEVAVRLAGARPR
jgi:NAD(P)H dehydrogenase (quinone)